MSTAKNYVDCRPRRGGRTMAQRRRMWRHWLFRLRQHLRCGLKGYSILGGYGITCGRCSTVMRVRIFNVPWGFGFIVRAVCPCGVKWRGRWFAKCDPTTTVDHMRWGER